MSDQDDQLEFDDTEEWQGGPIGSMGPSLPSGNKPFDPDFSKVFGGEFITDANRYIGGGVAPLITGTQQRNPSYLGGIPMFGGNPLNSQNETKESCDHQPINVGFNVSKIVCKKCDKDL